MSDAPIESPAVTAVRVWVERFVIGVGLCPFAKPAISGIVYVEIPDANRTSLLHTVLDAAEALVAMPEDQPGTTLLVAPTGLESFDDYLDALDAVNHMLSDADFDGVLQVASFHPDYLFDGEDVDDPSNWSNRAPFPVFHLLREADVTLATDTHPDAAGIPLRNRALLRRMGMAKIQALVQGIAPHR